MNSINEEERRLLGSLITKTESNEEGNLHPYPREALLQLRGAMAYMHEKYPMTDLEFRYFDPDVRTTDTGVLIVNIKGSPVLHKTRITKAHDEYIFADDLYGELLQQPYDEALEKELSVFGGPLQTYTMFYSFAGKQINGKTEVTDILNNHPFLHRHSDLFVSGRLNVSEEMKKHLAAKGFYGSYTVFHTAADHRIPVSAKERCEGTQELCSFIIRAKGEGS